MTGTYKSFTGDAPLAHLTVGITGTPANFTVDNATGFPTGAGGVPFVVSVDRGTAKEEKILCSSTSGNVVVVQTRGWDSTAQTDHASGATVEHTLDADTLNDLEQHVHTVRDDHSNYHTDGRHDAHIHPASVFATGPGVISRSMLSTPSAGFLVGQIVEIVGTLNATEQMYLLPADGSAVSRTTWAALFARVGVVYGPGDGATTFNLPDLRDMARIGACAIAPVLQTGSNGFAGTRSARVEASTVGEETHTLTTPEIPAHLHTLTDPKHTHTLNDPKHFHTNSQQVAVANSSSSIGFTSPPTNRGTYDAVGNVTMNSAATGVTAATASTGISMANTGGGGAHNVMQPSIAIPAYIVAA